MHFFGGSGGDELQDAAYLLADGIALLSGDNDTSVGTLLSDPSAWSRQKSPMLNNKIVRPGAAANSNCSSSVLPVIPDPVSVIMSTPRLRNERTKACCPESSSQ